MSACSACPQLHESKPNEGGIVMTEHTEMQEVMVEENKDLLEKWLTLLAEQGEKAAFAQIKKVKNREKGVNRQ